MLPFCVLGQVLQKHEVSRNALDGTDEKTLELGLTSPFFVQETNPPLVLELQGTKQPGGGFEVGNVDSIPEKLVFPEVRVFKRKM